MKRISLRLIELTPTEGTVAIKLRTVKTAVDKILPISWETEPYLHPKGGYIIIGMVPAETDLQNLEQNLKNVGYSGVI